MDRNLAKEYPEIFDYPGTKTCRTQARAYFPTTNVETSFKTQRTDDKVTTLFFAIEALAKKSRSVTRFSSSSNIDK
jgi:hypothetical protein